VSVFDLEAVTLSGDILLEPVAEIFLFGLTEIRPEEPAAIRSEYGIIDINLRHILCHSVEVVTLDEVADRIHVWLRDL